MPHNAIGGNINPKYFTGEMEVASTTLDEYFRLNEVDFSNFNAILKTSLRTGDFDIVDNEITNPKGEKAQQPTSHNKMNKDKANTAAGKLAEKVATEHTIQILKQLKEEE